MMSKEYILRNEVIERIRRVYCLDCESMKRYGDVCCDSCGIGDALNIIDDQPAADVVEGVRCKDCKFWKKQQDSLQGRCCLNNIYPTGYWYCGNGERGEK